MTLTRSEALVEKANAVVLTGGSAFGLDSAGGVMRCTLVSFIKNPCEQGRWAAQAALDVLAGAAPSEIPPAVNKESRVLLNMTLAEQLGFRFPMELIERADFLEESWAP